LFLLYTQTDAIWQLCPPQGSPLTPATPVSGSTLQATQPSSIICGQCFTETATVTSNTNAAPTGDVTWNFYNSNNVLILTISALLTQTSSTTATATMTTSLPTGTYTVTISYIGSLPATQQLTVGPAPTNIALALSPTTPLICGEPFVFTATLTDVCATPEGSVQFTINNLNPQTEVDTESENLSDGVATYSSSGLAAGNYQVVVTYGGDPNSQAQTFTEDFTVGPAPTQIALSFSNNAPTCGQSFTVSGIVSSTCFEQPQGTLTFTFSYVDSDGDCDQDQDDCIVTQTVTLANGTGSASFSLNAGTYVVSASYSGDTNSQSSTVILSQQFVVSKAPCFVNLNITGGLNLLIGTAFTWNGVCGASQSGISILPTGGSLSLVDGNSNILEVVSLLEGLGGGNCNGLLCLQLGVGVHHLTCQYGGDSCFNPCISAAVNLNIHALI